MRLSAPASPGASISRPSGSTASSASGPTARTRSRVPCPAASESSESTDRPLTHSPPREHLDLATRSGPPRATNRPAGRAWKPELARDDEVALDRGRLAHVFGSGRSSLASEMLRWP